MMTQQAAKKCRWDGWFKVNWGSQSCRCRHTLTLHCSLSAHTEVLCQLFTLDVAAQSRGIPSYHP